MHETSRHRDEGSALVITVMVMALVAVLGTTVLGVTVNNLGATRRATDATLALDAADAGLNQAVAYLRSSGTRALDACSPACGAANPWGDEETPMSAPVANSDDQRYESWIVPQPGGSADARTYRVHSRGLAGAGEARAQRLVEADVTVSLVDVGLPLGVYARSVQGAGTPDLSGVSIFSTGCVWNRSKIDFGGTTDAAYGIPAAVHSSQVITDRNGNNKTCSGSDSKAIHRSQPCPSGAFRWDQDSIGGPCSDLAGAHPRYYGRDDLDGDGDIDVDGTFLADDAALLDLFGIEDDPLPEWKLAELRTVATSQGSYWRSASGWSVPDPATYPNSVLYFDLTRTEPGGTVDLKALGSTWAQSSCEDGAWTRSLLIVIDGGNVKMNGNSEVAASIVLTSRTYGEVDKGNGNPDYVGTLFANTLNLAGAFDFELNQCFLDNLSPSLFSVSVEDYQEIDR